MSPMAAVAHQVVGLIDIPTDVPWSADAIVSECLGIAPGVRDRDRWIIAGRLPARPPFDLARLTADLPQLQDDLDQLLESFLVNCPH
jgi:hypothetical protein